MGLFNVNCNEAGHICDKSQYSEAGLWEIIKLKIHHSYCKICREHSKQNSVLTKLLKSAGIEILDQKTKAKMEEDFQKELAKHQE